MVCRPDVHSGNPSTIRNTPFGGPETVTAHIDLMQDSTDEVQGTIETRQRLKSQVMGLIGQEQLSEQPR